jgi:hypothetical protein
MTCREFVRFNLKPSTSGYALQRREVVGCSIPKRVTICDVDAAIRRAVVPNEARRLSRPANGLS